MPLIKHLVNETKRVYLLIFLLLLVLSLSACSSDSQKIKELEAQVSSLQAQLSEESVQSSSSQPSNTDSLLSESSASQAEVNPDVTIVVVNKTNIPKNINAGLFSDQARLHISITNNTDKDIKGIQGVLDIQDMFGKSFLKSQCDLVGHTILPNETYLNEDLALEINQFMDDHMKLYNTDFSDLKFEYTVETIMFTDGTTK